MFRVLREMCMASWWGGRTEEPASVNSVDKGATQTIVPS
jgi:hypothetical protein